MIEGALGIAVEFFYPRLMLLNIGINRCIFALQFMEREHGIGFWIFAATNGYCEMAVTTRNHLHHFGNMRHRITP